MHLHPEADAAGVRLVAHDALGSTNAEALARARAGERGPLWVTAARQTAGRGRRGNAWTSQPGNLYASLLLTDPAPPAHLPELCFVVALAVLDAASCFIPVAVDVPSPACGGGLLGNSTGEMGRGLKQAPLPIERVQASAWPSPAKPVEDGRERPDAGRGHETLPAQERLQLKWPNDLLLDGAKFAGILIEAETIGGAGAVAVGIGVNCAHHPDGLAYPATDLSAGGAAVLPEAFFAALSRAMVLRLAQWNRGAGFAAIRAAWLAHAAGIGGDIVVRLPDRELSGKFEALDRMGRLMLRLPAGTLEAITVGEVFPLTPARGASLADPAVAGQGSRI